MMVVGHRCWIGVPRPSPIIWIMMRFYDTPPKGNHSGPAVEADLGASPMNYTMSPI